MQAVKNNDSETFQLEVDSLSSSSCEYDPQAVKDQVAAFNDGLNVYHYAAENQSVFVMEELVKYLKGIIEELQVYKYKY